MKKFPSTLGFLAGTVTAAALPPAQSMELVERPASQSPAAEASRPTTVTEPIPTLDELLQPALAEPEKGPDGYWRINFKHLASFVYQLPGGDKAEAARPATGGTDGIPANVRELDGRLVRIEGYMLPVSMDKNGAVKEFLILRNVMSCCYGVTPRPNEWLLVRMNAKAAKVDPSMDTPLVFYGKLHVGATYRENMFAGIYQLDCEKVAGK